MKQTKYIALALLALLVAFITLKLTNIIDWSWWWITAPAWVPTAIAVCFLIYIIIYIWIHPDELNCAEEGDNANAMSHPYPFENGWKCPDMHPYRRFRPRCENFLKGGKKKNNTDNNPPSQFSSFLFLPLSFIQNANNHPQ